MSKAGGTKDAAKRILKRAAARPDRVTNAPRILTYHSVGTRDHSMNVTVRAFEEQMAWLVDNAAFRSVEECLDGAPGVAVTFDDGYRDNLTNVAPIMTRFEIPWTVYIVTGRLGSWLDHDDQTDDARLMTHEEVVQLAQAGAKFGGHTHTHARLSALSSQGQTGELDKCISVLDDLGIESPGFAYPYGSVLDYSDQSCKEVAAAGFTYAVSNRYGPVMRDDGRWCARRIWIDRTDDMQSFQAKATGALDDLAWLDAPLIAQARRAVNNLFAVR